MTAASEASTVNVSGRPMMSWSNTCPSRSRSASPSARKKKSNRPRSAVRAVCSNDEKSIWLPDSGRCQSVWWFTPPR